MKLVKPAGTESSLITAVDEPSNMCSVIVWNEVFISKEFIASVFSIGV